MPIAQALLPEFEHEMANTRKTLERVPFEKSEWRPHPKSPTLLWLAGHVANLPELDENHAFSGFAGHQPTARGAAPRKSAKIPKRTACDVR